MDVCMQPNLAHKTSPLCIKFRFVQDLCLDLKFRLLCLDLSHDRFGFLSHVLLFFIIAGQVMLALVGRSHWPSLLHP